MRIVLLALALAMGSAAMAQDRAPKKKPAAKQVAHKKATPQQIKKFDELQKKRQSKAE